jgi:hypothetical protein
MGVIRKNWLQVAIFICIALLFAEIIILVQQDRKAIVSKPTNKWWGMQSVDTVKYSRDLARAKVDDPEFTAVVDKQISEIANIGATHVAIGTPYDEEFVPFLTLWVNAARKYGLNVWFRGNFSGWEGWFEYEPIGKQEHLTKTKNFIVTNASLFEDGDIFTSCTECENGSIGDPRYDVDVEVYRRFIIDEYQLAKDCFEVIGKKVASNYYPMNGDVAYLVMDRKTTRALDGVVVLDHYVKEPKRVANDIREIALNSGGEVVLGEFGAPIPDIHGQMTENQEAEWIRHTFNELTNVEGLVGINYWTSSGGSTELWRNNKSREAVGIMESFYSPVTITVRVLNELGKPVKNAEIIAGIKRAEVNRNGEGEIIIIPSISKLSVKANSYKERSLDIAEINESVEIVLEKEQENIIFKIQRLFFN